MKTDIPLIAKANNLSAPEAQKIINKGEAQTRRIINQGAMPSLEEGCAIAKRCGVHPEKLLNSNIDETILAEHEISILEKDIRKKNEIIHQFRKDANKYDQLFEGVIIYLELNRKGEIPPSFFTDSLYTSIKSILK